MPIITTFMRLSVGLQVVLARNVKNLAHDLARRQIPLQTHQRGQAELAIDRAADLARNADRVAALFRHEHGFNRAIILEPQQIAARAVARVESVFEPRAALRMVAVSS